MNKDDLITIIVIIGLVLFLIVIEGYWTIQSKKIGEEIVKEITKHDHQYYDCYMDTSGVSFFKPKCEVCENE